MPSNPELEKALTRVGVDAKAQYTYHMAQIGGKPLSGWSQEKHDTYHKEHAEKAKLVRDWCFVREMQHNPD